MGRPTPPRAMEMLLTARSFAQGVASVIGIFVGSLLGIAFWVAGHQIWITYIAGDSEVLKMIGLYWPIITLFSFAMSFGVLVGLMVGMTRIGPGYVAMMEALAALWLKEF